MFQDGERAELKVDARSGREVSLVVLRRHDEQADKWDAVRLCQIGRQRQRAVVVHPQVALEPMYHRAARLDRIALRRRLSERLLQNIHGSREFTGSVLSSTLVGHFGGVEGALDNAVALLIARVVELWSTLLWVRW